MNSELIVGRSAFEVLADEWDSLAARGMTDTPFQTLAYQRAWWTHLQPAGSELLTVATRHDSTELAGIGCFYHNDGRLCFNGSLEESDYLDLIAPGEAAAQVWESVVDCLETVERPQWTTLVLDNVPAASPTRSVLPDLAVRRNLTYREHLVEVCPIVSLPPTFDAYLDSLESKQRRELSRKLRRAGGAEATCRVVESRDDVADEVDRFLALLQKSTFEKRDWLNAERRAFFHAVALSAQSAGTLQLMFIAIEGTEAAALFNFDYKGRIWVYNSGLDPAAYSAVSPGVVLTAMAIELAISLGRKEFDFLRGDEEYKYRFGATDSRIYRLELERQQG